MITKLFKNSYRPLMLLLLTLLLTFVRAEGFDFQSSAVQNSVGIFGLSELSPSEKLSLLTDFGGNNKNNLFIESGYSRQFQLSEFDNVFIAAFLKKKKFSFAVGLSQFGSRKFYSERLSKLAVAYSFKNLVLGTYFSLLSINFGSDYKGISSGAVGFSFSARLNYLSLAFSADNINSPSYNGRSLGGNPTYTIYADLTGKTGHSLLASLKMEEFEKPIFVLIQENKLSDLARISLRVSTAPLVYGGGLKMKYKKQEIIYFLSFHNILGLSHGISFIYSFGKDS